MMWGKIRISDFGSVVTGTTPPTKNPEYYGYDYPFITPSDIDQGRIVNTSRGISEKAAVRFSNRIIPPHSICFVCIGATIGKICLTSEPSLTNQQINSIVVDGSRHNPYFAYYLLSTKTDLVKNIAGGAATPIVNKTAFENIKVSIPPLSIQNKIAAILSAYDNLIENNLRRIQILEEMAHSLYREWFVHFRFPGYERARMVDSPLGKIPEGWDWQQLGDVCELRREKYVDKLHNHLPLLDLSRIPRNTLLINEIGNYSDISTSRIIFNEYDVLFGSIRPYLHKVIVAPFTGITNVSVFVISALNRDYLYYLPIILSSKSTVDWANQYSRGTKMPVIKWDDFRTMPIIIPAKETLQLFTKCTKSIVDNIINVAISNLKLKEIRDLLIPKLMSGELDVSEIDINY